jgi:ApaG protein
MKKLISITVNSEFLGRKGRAKERVFAFAYHIKITNNSRQSIQLLSRYWLITDGNNSTHEIHGSGVLGQQPYIAAGESFEYSSNVMLPTPVGSMQGHYQMISQSGDYFDAPIRVFPLALPMAVH